MKKITIVFIAFFLCHTTCFGEEAVPVSAVLEKLANDSSQIIGKEIFMSSCGVNVLECCGDPQSSFVLHVDNREYTEAEYHRITRENHIMVYGDKKSRKAGRRFGYKRCGTYKGHIEKNPYSEQQKIHNFVFIVTEIIEERKRDIRKELREKKNK